MLKRTKKLFFIGLILVLTLTFTGCFLSGEEEEETNGSPVGTWKFSSYIGTEYDMTFNFPAYDLEVDLDDDETKDIKISTLNSYLDIDESKMRSIEKIEGVTFINGFDGTYDETSHSTGDYEGTWFLYEDSYTVSGNEISTEYGSDYYSVSGDTLTIKFEYEGYDGNDYTDSMIYKRCDISEIAGYATSFFYE